ncbi:MAG: HD domain-containing protein [Bdellovibrionaceae bacterium]|nr:HD domain-containing protein [Pseudobdellovibrionaceae bacterium]
MEIRDPVHGSIELSKEETRVIDNEFFQRLRSIKQLGFSEFSFPGATHNRYIHSIGVCHLSGIAFDSIFKSYKFSSQAKKKSFRDCLRLGALLHDVGHGPLSHAAEKVMPLVSELEIDVYNNKERAIKSDERATHEDYSIKIIMDSSLSEELKLGFPHLDPVYVACLIDRTLPCPDDFFVDQGVDFRNILSQVVSSEMDVDRMDYLGRDSYFCGTNYGKVELTWLLQNITYYNVNDELFLALNRRALYTFDDFLLSRHHMHLMVYFHHKSIVYEEMLLNYLESPDCNFKFPADINEYLAYTDYSLFVNLNQVKNTWAQRIAKKDPYRMLFEHHSTHDNDRCEKMRDELQQNNVDAILSNSTARLSKYHSASEVEKSMKIYVVDQYDPNAKPYAIEESTEIFQKYEEIRRIERLYVSPQDVEKAKKVLSLNV